MPSMRCSLAVLLPALLLTAIGCQREQWESLNERAEPELINEINVAIAEVEDYRKQKRNLLTSRTRELNGAFGWPPRQEQLDSIANNLQAVDAASNAARERAQMALLALINRFPRSPSRQLAENLVLGEECATIQRLHDERMRIAANLEDPPEVSGDSPIEFALSIRRLDEQRLAALDAEVGARLTRLCARFPESQRVKEVDRAIVFPRYQDLNRALSRMPAANGDDVEIEPEEAADLLAALAELKRLYPRSAWTREAERKVSPLTAKRELRDLWGWPVVIFLFFSVLLLTELGRCLGAFKRRAPQSEKQQVLRAQSVETDLRKRAGEARDGDIDLAIVNEVEDATDRKGSFRFESPPPQRFRLPLVQSSRQLAAARVEDAAPVPEEETVVADETADDQTGPAAAGAERQPDPDPHRLPFSQGERGESDPGPASEQP